MLTYENNGHLSFLVTRLPKPTLMPKYVSLALTSAYNSDNHETVYPVRFGEDPIKNPGSLRVAPEEELLTLNTKVW